MGVRAAWLCWWGPSLGDDLLGRLKEQGGALLQLRGFRHLSCLLGVRVSPGHGEVLSQETWPRALPQHGQSPGTGTASPAFCWDKRHRALA